MKKNISSEAYALIEIINEIINSEAGLSRNSLQKLVILKERIPHLKTTEEKKNWITELLGFLKQDD